jgi:hypothetical protein
MKITTARIVHSFGAALGAAIGADIPDMRTSLSPLSQT